MSNIEEGGCLYRPPLIFESQIWISFVDLGTINYGTLILTSKKLVSGESTYGSPIVATLLCTEQI